jgi:Polyketide cyclase / dehydrase and lipid transport
VRIRSDQRHRFDVAPDELWAAMASVDRYREWWPWLRRFDAAGLAAGEVWTATVQPPLPYRVSFDLHLTEVSAPRVVVADVTGDIEGSARLEVFAVDGGSELHFTSELCPTNSVLRAVARLASPIARYGHEWVLTSGLDQFRARAL